MSQTVVIERGFHGYQGVAHGGYVSGMVAREVGGPSQVTLRSLPPLGVMLAFRRDDRGAVFLVDGDRVVAKGIQAEPPIEVPRPPSLDEARAATALFPAERSPSPTCLCCGHRRKEGEGLLILPGPIRERDLVAAPWIPHPAFSDDDGTVRPEFVWAALDCPGAWGLRLRYPEGARRLTVRMSGRILGPVPVGEPQVVIGWPIDHRRRLFECGSGVFGPDGELRAFAHATWMVPVKAVLPEENRLRQPLRAAAGTDPARTA